MSNVEVGLAKEPEPILARHVGVTLRVASCEVHVAGDAGLACSLDEPENSGTLENAIPSANDDNDTRVGTAPDQAEKVISTAGQHNAFLGRRVVQHVIIWGLSRQYLAQECNCMPLGGQDVTNPVGYVVVKEEPRDYASSSSNWRATRRSISV
jgi:hypothetical protein